MTTPRGRRQRAVEFAVDVLACCAVCARPSWMSLRCKLRADQHPRYGRQVRLTVPGVRQPEAGAGRVRKLRTRHHLIPLFGFDAAWPLSCGDRCDRGRVTVVSRCAFPSARVLRGRARHARQRALPDGAGPLVPVHETEIGARFGVRLRPEAQCRSYYGRTGGIQLNRSSASAGGRARARCRA